MPRNSSAARFLTEIIDIPGLCGVGITRADNYRAMIDAGYDARTADQFSFSRMCSAVATTVHPRAFDIAVAIGRDEFRSLDDFGA